MTDIERSSDYSDWENYEIDNFIAFHMVLYFVVGFALGAVWL